MKYPGCFINASILEGLMRKAKKEKLTLIIALLDIIQAYDKVGHEHIIKILHFHSIPTHLRNLIISLIVDNKTQILTAEGKTKIIHFLYALLQGSPVSPFLFNIAIDPVLDALTEKELPMNLDSVWILVWKNSQINVLLMTIASSRTQYSVQRN